MTWSRNNSWAHRYSNSDLSVVQPVASRYTDNATLAPCCYNYSSLYNPIQLFGFNFNLVYGFWTLAGTQYTATGGEVSCMRVNSEAEESMALGAVTKQQPVKTADWEDLVLAVINCGVCELARAL
jgi:hypothetical protein